LKLTWNYSKRARKSFIGFAIAIAVLSIIGAIVPIFAAQIIIDLSSSNFTQLINISIIIFTFEMLRNILRFFTNKFSQIFYRETLIDIQIAIAKETIKIESSIIDNSTSGVFIDRLTKDANEIAMIFNSLNRFLIDILVNIGVLFAVLIISREMFLFFVIALLILFTFKIMRAKVFYDRDKVSREFYEKNTGLASELVRGIKDIKVLNATEVFTKKVLEKVKISNEMRYKLSAIARNYDLVTTSIQNLISLIFIIYGIYLTNNGYINVASFIILYMYQNRIYNLLESFAIIVEELKKFDVAASRTFEIIDSEKYKKEVFGTKSLKNIKGNFEFKDVSFGYNSNTKIFDNLSFKINANETVAFVGKSGVGKTTIFSLITKLYNVDSGSITIDSVDINELDCESIRGNISIITQNPYIFNFSVKDNLSLVKEDMTDKEMIAACKLACIHDFIMTLPDKYDSVVGEGGILLSGGQRQRLAIARALIKKSEIILFDEATSALDNETQQNIQEAINNMKKKNTILIIAHRLSTIINSDRIIVLDEGKIVAEGTHLELLKTNIVYRHLYETELVTDN
jgi:ABC-type multidrug transport system fused ATPase/permease subunit